MKTTIKTVKVESSHLYSVGYNPKKETMFITFHRGGIPTSTYSYRNIPEEIFQGLVTAKSKGKYFHEFIRGFYQYQRLGGEKSGERSSK